MVVGCAPMDPQGKLAPGRQSADRYRKTLVETTYTMVQMPYRGMYGCLSGHGKGRSTVAGRKGRHLGLSC